MTNEETIKAHLVGKKTDQTKSLWSNGNQLFSYNTLIAFRNKAVSPKKISPTTAKHISLAKKLGIS